MLELSTGLDLWLTPTAQRLLDERRTERQRHVDQRLAAAKARFLTFTQSIGPDLIHDTIAQKEAMTWDAVPRLINYESIGTMRPCPGCNQNGMLLGDLELDPQVDVIALRTDPYTTPVSTTTSCPTPSIATFALWSCRTAKNWKSLASRPNGFNSLGTS